MPSVPGTALSPTCNARCGLLVPIPTNPPVTVCWPGGTRFPPERKGYGESVHAHPSPGGDEAGATVARTVELIVGRRAEGERL